LNARRQGGYGDYTRKEKRGVYRFLKKFLIAENGAGTIRFFVDGLPKNLMASTKQGAFLIFVQPIFQHGIRLLVWQELLFVLLDLVNSIERVS
jgi:hypothetical protein